MLDSLSCQYNFSPSENGTIILVRLHNALCTTKLLHILCTTDKCVCVRYASERKQEARALVLDTVRALSLCLITS